MDLSTALVCLYSMKELELILYSCGLNQDKMEVLLTALYNCNKILSLCLNIARNDLNNKVLEDLTKLIQFLPQLKSLELHLYGN